VVLNSDAEVNVEISDDGQSEQVTANFPPADALSGFSVLFRQYYANEAAGFQVVSKIMKKLANNETDARAQARVDELKKWSRAIGRLRQFSVERLVHEKLAAEAVFPPLTSEEAATYPDLEIPQQAISAYFYGEHIHWGDKSVLLEQRAEDSFDEATYLLGYLKAATGLAHMYLGYAVLVGTAIGLST